MGPLAGVKVIEIAGLGAAPYGCMMLADMGADVVCVARPGEGLEAASPLMRNRRCLSLDLKEKIGRGLLLQMAESADVIVESFRPGVVERLGVGPAECFERNPRIVYARMTGWGQTGPLAHTAGHDLNYISVAGVLHQMGPEDGKPAIPLNLIGDFGGGGLLMAFGILCALWESRSSGRGQIVDAAMLDGALSFMAMFFGHREQGLFDDRTGAHFLGGAAPYYGTYQTSDGRYLSVAPIEPKFYRKFLERLGLHDARWVNAGYGASSAGSRSDWQDLKDQLAKIFKSKTRDEWCALFADSDVCVTPVLSLAEAAVHPHNAARRAFIEVAGVLQNAPAPRFSRTGPEDPTPPPASYADIHDILAEWASCQTAKKPQ
jgi:alpha-methylacyl-CoA racemase